MFNVISFATAHADENNYRAWIEHSSGFKIVAFIHKITYEVRLPSTVALEQSLYHELCEYLREYCIEFDGLSEQQKALIERLSESLKVRDIRRN